MTNRSVHEQVRDWLQEAGFHDAMCIVDESLDTAHVRSSGLVARVHQSRRAGAADVQLVYGLSQFQDVAGAVFSVAGFTNEAAAWADDAGVALYSVRETGIQPANRAAVAVVARDLGEGLALADTLRQQEDQDRPMSLLGYPRDESDPQFLLHLGVRECVLCGQRQRSARMGNCELCEDRLPNRRWLWRLVMVGRRTELDRIIGAKVAEFSFRPEVDGPTDIIRAGFPEAELAWQGLFTSLASIGLSVDDYRIRQRA